MVMQCLNWAAALLHKTSTCTRFLNHLLLKAPYQNGMTKAPNWRCPCCHSCSVLQYDFYFAYCEAAFDAKYIHDFHVTWEKRQAAGGTSGSGAKSRDAPVMEVAGQLQGWVKQELPSDSITQVRQVFDAWHVACSALGEEDLLGPHLALAHAHVMNAGTYGQGTERGCG